MKGEQLRRHTVWQVWTQLEGETAAFACLYTTDHKCMIPTLPPPTSTSPSPTTSRVNCWRVWSNEIHEDRDNHLRVHVHSLIWMMIHIGREVNSPGDTANGRTCKRYRAKSYVYGCVWASMFAVRREGEFLHEAALQSTSSVIYHSSQGVEEGSPCSVSKNNHWPSHTRSFSTQWRMSWKIGVEKSLVTLANFALLFCNPGWACYKISAYDWIFFYQSVLKKTLEENKFWNLNI